MKCYSSAKKAVEAGAVTWDELVGLELALSKSDAGNDPFTLALNKKMEGNDANNS